MASKSRKTKKTAPARKASLRRVLNKNKKIKKNVRQAANKLTAINEVLKQVIEVNAPGQSMEEAITQNEDVEQKVARAADELQEVNLDLAREVSERVVIESELADTKTDLAEVREDLSKSRAQEEQARNSMLQDALTGLPNRMLFEQDLQQALTQAKRYGWELAVLFIDIDNFKSINDAHGHDVGDKVLLTVAERLQTFIRDEDTVSRWGGDEFVCLLLQVKQEADVTRMAEKMVDRIAAASDFNGIVLSIRASIGIAIYPADGETADILFKNADMAMFKAKGSETKVVRFRESAPD